MFKITIEDLLAEVKEEMMCYEELGEEAATRWEKRFLLWLHNDKIKKPSIKQEKGKTYYTLQDEADLFSIIDHYWAAIENNEEDVYWNKFQ